MKQEEIFERDLAFAAAILKCAYLKIKDTRSINKSNRYNHKEVKRICDGILIIKNGGTYLIECKYQYNCLERHQKDTESLVNKLNGTFYIFRKKLLKSGVIYAIEQSEKNIIFETTKIEELIIYFLAK